MKLLDAMGCGALVVASSVGDIPRWLQPDAGIMFQPGRPIEMADAIQLAFKSGNNGDQMRSNCATAI